MPKTFKPKDWLKGLIGAVVGSAAHTVLVTIVDPHFTEWDRLLRLLAGSALISFALYVKKSPLFPEDKE